MFVLQLALFALVAVGGAVTVLTRNLRRQILFFSLFGMLLTMLFVVLQSPDVALSELTVGTVALPLMLLVAITSVEHTDKEKK